MRQSSQQRLGMLSVKHDAESCSGKGLVLLKGLLGSGHSSCRACRRVKHIWNRCGMSRSHAVCVGTSYSEISVWRSGCDLSGTQTTSSRSTDLPINHGPTGDAACRKENGTQGDRHHAALAASIRTPKLRPQTAHYT